MNKDAHSRPIGVFDSGLGGLTVVKEIKKILPNEDIEYLGDTARVPYGTRSKEVVTKFALEDLNFLLKKRVKCIVVACNTVSALAIGAVRENSPVTVFDAISPAVKAIKETGMDKIGILGTRGTINSHTHKRKLPGIKVYEQACPLFVPYIEEGEVKGELIEKLTKKYLKNFRKYRLEAVVLACTHYPILSELIQKELGDAVLLIDPAVEITKDINMYLKINGLLNKQKSAGNIQYWVTDLNENFQSQAESFLEESLNDNLNVTNL